MKAYIFTFFIALFFLTTGYSQDYIKSQLKGGTNPDELVTLSANIPFNQAIELLSKVSENATGKKIVSIVDNTAPIGIEIPNLPYRKALILIVKFNGYTLEDKPDVIIVKKNVETKEKQKENYVPIDQKQVKISAVFFEINVNESKQRGIDWRFLLEGENLGIGSQIGNITQKVGVDQTTQTGTGGTSGSGTSGTSGSSTNNLTPEFKLSLNPKFNIGNFFGDATALFKFFEDQQLGDIIASPNITVSDGTQARLQDGQDISIKQKDFAGNIIENFYSTGSIVTVTPHVLTEEGINYILLNIDVIRSSYVPDPNNTIINKTSATTQVVLLDGEETVIGGMFINQTTKIRTGIPFLKDLPWWVFGLRYIFGSDQNQVIKKELVILIKADLVPTIKERLAYPQTESPLKKELENNRKKLKLYQFNQEPTKTKDN